MQKLTIIICLLLASKNIFAQKDYGVIAKYIDAKKFAGKKFKFEATVKVDTLNSNSKAELIFRVDRKNHKTGFFKKTVMELNDWKKYTIENIINKDADSIFLGALFYRKGIFYLDDFKLYVENEKGEYDKIKFEGWGFENESVNQFWDFNYSKNNFTISLNKETFFEGKQSLKIDGSNCKINYEYGKNIETGKYALINGINFYYETYGSGEPMLLLHGNSESINSFKLQIAEFAKKYRVIVVDTRGHGNSSINNERYTYDLFADDMNALLNYLKIDKANIVGWSDGGNTGLIMAMKFPEKVNRLVTMGANVFIDKTVVDKWIFKALDKEIKSLKSDTTSYAINKIRLTNLLLTEPKHNFEEFKAILCPVLVMAGEKDIIKENHTKAIAASIKNSSLFIAPNETHYFPQENAAGFNKVVLDFLEK